MGRRLKVFWWNKYPNLGDALTPLLLEHYGYDVERAEAHDADVCVIGSILETVGPSFGGAIVGAGFLSDGPTMAFAHARILCVRGSLTARRAALRDTVVLGDAGLLSPALLPHRPQAHTRIGIVPHYKDKALPSIRALAERGDTDIHVIDVQDEPRKVLAAIAECEVVLSSSLHGLIAGDAFGRSTAWLTLSDQVLGDGFKFKDYASSIGVTVQPARISGTESTDQLAALASHKEYNRAAVHRRLESVFARL